jgi:cytochrome c553
MKQRIGFALAAAALAAFAQGVPAAGGGSSAPDGAAVSGNAAAGAAKAAMCIGCHGIEDYRTAYPEVYRVPLLGGQNQQYLEHALRAYRAKERHFAPMNAIAASLTDQDIADLAAYYAAQTAVSPDNPYK